MRRLLLLCVVFICLINIAFSQGDEVWFQPNRGQWDSRILYKVELVKGDFFIEKDKFTYALSDLGEVYHTAHTGGEIDKIQHHTVHSHFLHSSWQGEIKESDSSSFYKNYLLGNDSTKWKSNVHSFKKLEFIDYYPGIDLIIETTPEHIKYSFRVDAGVDPSIIQIYHEGMKGLEVNKNQVEIKTRFGSIIENGLEVWNETDAQERTSVESEFAVHQDTVYFHFPKGFDTTKTLIIDPSLTFSTFTGSTADNWGFTAAPDNNGNLYAGGIVFGTGYPISTGAYDGTFNSGFGYYKIDIGISKFSSNGANLLYSTYLGGNGNETPNSIITNNQGELYILGITSSTNFPVTPNAYQSVNKGGTSTTQIAIDFEGTDITVSKLSSDGSSLLASTYLGGDANDGLNISSLNYNYGDVFRGEIILDKNGDVVIASSTQSPNFPTANASNTTLGGNQDAVVVKLNPNLSSLIWSTYLGGSNDDAGYSVQVSSSNNLFVTGGTKSSGLPFSGGYKSTFQGGSCDGFVVELNGTTANIVNGTYIGANKYDQSYFVQLDLTDRVYVFGQTEGNMPVTPGVYSNPNSGQFIQQYSSDLSTLNWSTIVGGGNGVVEISPTAFLVSNCNEIYFTGWGGQVNHSVQAFGSTSNGFPVTSDAYQSNTNGNNFYVGVLSENAASLSYGTFMGGTASSYNHVDGGTSRFDKHGSIYHAVCAACGGNPNGFTTTPGVFSETNNSSNCNLAAWKFDLGAIHASVSSPDVFICLPDSAHFTNESQNGSIYFWDFGDGSTSTEFEPSHFYSQPGVYDVMLVVSDEDGCFEPDTTFLVIEIAEFHGAIVQPPGFVCPGEPFQLEASNGINYQWSPAQFLDNPNSPTPIATVDSTTTFTVIVSDSCGSDTLSLVLEVSNTTSDASDDFEICKGDTVQIWASGGIDYLWSAPNTNAIVSPPNQASIFVAPTNTMNFTVDIVTADGCDLTETVKIKVYQDVPHPILDDTSFICKDETLQVVAGGAPSIFWSPNIDITPTFGPVVTISTKQNRWYYVDFTNPCGTVKDSIFIEVVTANSIAGNDTIICPNEQAHLWAVGGIKYHWSPSESVFSPNEGTTIVKPKTPTIYTVIITDKYGCIDSSKVTVDLYPAASVQASNDYYGFSGDKIPLSAEGSGIGGSYTWSPKINLSCDVCQQPTASPANSVTYAVTYEDENGCKATDDVRVIYDALIYVPNTFTPDLDEFNEVFKAVGGNIANFEITIFNRWGETLFQSYDMNIGWDGTYGGEVCPDGTYIWKIKYTDIEHNKKEMVGHVNLLR